MREPANISDERIWLTMHFSGTLAVVADQISAVILMLLSDFLQPQLVFLVMFDFPTSFPVYFPHYL